MNQVVTTRLECASHRFYSEILTVCNITTISITSDVINNDYAISENNDVSSIMDSLFILNQQEIIMVLS